MSSPKKKNGEQSETDDYEDDVPIPIDQQTPSYPSVKDDKKISTIEDFEILNKIGKFQVAYLITHSLFIIR